MHPRLGALAALRLTDPDAKMAATRELAARVLVDTPDDDTGLAGCSTLSTPIRSPGDDLGVPGRPQRPLRVAATAVERRSPFTTEGRAALMHAICHIEFNAVNLALDAAWRYDGMPEAYYLDWLRVADEEALHFTMLSAHLATLGYAYGDFPGHESLWEMVAKTSDDVMARMALVPRTLEARGLDAIPPLRKKIAQAGDLAAALILDRLLVDEVGHVEIGNRWYFSLCEERGLEPIATYDELTVRYKAPVLKGPFNIEGRRQAGFTEAELQRYR